MGVIPGSYVYSRLVDEVYDVSNLPEDFTSDHAIECVGGSELKMHIVKLSVSIQPQGTVVAMGA